MFKKLIGICGLLVLAVLFLAQSRVSTADTSIADDSSQINAQQWQQPPGGGIQPFSGAPKCAYHDPTQWHSLWNYQSGCHYDHEHKHNPGIIYAGIPADEYREAQAMLDLFGPPGAWFNGTSISYPWQTFMGAGENYPAQPTDYMHYENSMKHEGYGWIVRYNLPRNWGKEWVRDFRLQFHAILAGPGMSTRFHSFSLEANVCKVDAACRIVRTGGWVDFGQLFIDGRLVDLGHGTEIDTDRRRLHFSVDNTSAYAGSQYNLPFFWYGTLSDVDATVPWNSERPFRKLLVSLAGKDVWTNPSYENPRSNDFFCPDFQCNKNGSTTQAHALHIETFGDSFTGWTDRYGEVNRNCGAPALDCIPTSVEAGNDPILVVYRDAGTGISAQGQRDFDISPEGEWWIEYPN